MDELASKTPDELRDLEARWRERLTLLEDQTLPMALLPDDPELIDIVDRMVFSPDTGPTVERLAGRGALVDSLQYVGLCLVQRILWARKVGGVIAAVQKQLQQVESCGE